MINSDNVIIKKGVDKQVYEGALSANRALKERQASFRDGINAIATQVGACSRYELCDKDGLEQISFFEKFFYPRDTDDEKTRQIMLRFFYRRENFFLIAGELISCKSAVNTDEKSSCDDIYIDKFKSLVASTLEPAEYSFLSPRITEAISDYLWGIGIAPDAVGGYVSEISRYLSSSAPIPTA